MPRAAQSRRPRRVRARLLQALLQEARPIVSRSLQAEKVCHSPTRQDRQRYQRTARRPHRRVRRSRSPWCHPSQCRRLRPLYSLVNLWPTPPNHMRRLSPKAAHRQVHHSRHSPLAALAHRHRQLRHQWPHPLSRWRPQHRDRARLSLYSAHHRSGRTPTSCFPRTRTTTHHQAGTT
jgi:hypothetical protein